MNILRTSSIQLGYQNIYIFVLKSREAIWCPIKRYDWKMASGKRIFFCLFWMGCLCPLPWTPLPRLVVSPFVVHWQLNMAKLFHPFWVGKANLNIYLKLLLLTESPLSYRGIQLWKGYDKSLWWIHLNNPPPIISIYLRKYVGVFSCNLTPRLV